MLNFFRGLILVLGGVLVTAALCTGCSSDAFKDHKFDNKDPKVGRVYLDYSHYKVCDGTTLYYATTSYRGGISTIPNSSECQ